MNDQGLLVITTTFAEKQTASEMAQRVIRAGLAACAQVDGPIESHYRWQGNPCQDTEWRLTMKTTNGVLNRLAELVHANHPYQTPQWIVLAVEQVTDGYRDWVRQAVIDEASNL